MTLQDAAIIGYCLFQIAGCFFVSRAIFRMIVQRKQELAQKPVPQRRAANDS